ncbi:MAG: methylenetetrahydrofolate reductase C-terminal domain-containing protein [Planctomycetota bacterium]
MLKALVVALEHGIKSSLFNCQMCGQCILTYTQLHCPMNCPKGLRNGPCGGTLEGRCEVYPDRACVWMEIRSAEARANNRQYPVPPVHAPVQPALFAESSYLNLVSGRDRATRRPQPYLELTPARLQPTPVGSGRFEAALRRGEFVVTTECHSPRDENGLKRVHRFGRAIQGRIAAVNTTSNVGGRATLPSRRTGAILQNEYGLEAIVQVCGRDVTAPAFLEELAATQAAGFRNLFCLTGDWNRSAHPAAEADAAPAHRRERWLAPIAERYFPMDAVQMLYEARVLRESGRSACLPDHTLTHRLFLGGAINPYSTPREFVIARLRQKLAAGLDFAQTQIVTETHEFARFHAALRQAGLADRLYLLASVPVVTSLKMLDLMTGLAGVRVDPAFAERLRAAPDIAAAGLEAALVIGRSLRTLGVQGVHLMPFGADGAQIAALAEALQESPAPPPAPKPDSLSALLAGLVEVRRPAPAGAV